MQTGHVTQDQNNSFNHLQKIYMFLGIVSVLDMTRELCSILGRIQREECVFLELYPDPGKENIVNQVQN